jgi:NAD(P)-dependent dehydrogenase (short-subunit alcohol dehydrogenase family)
MSLVLSGAIVTGVAAAAAGPRRGQARGRWVQPERDPPEPSPIQAGLRANSTSILGADAPVMRGVGGDEAAVKAVTPMGRRGTVEEIAPTALFLAGADAGYITGHTLVIDGGWTAR